MKIAGLCVHGLMGNVYSLGMDALAAKLNRATPNDVHFMVDGGNDPSAISADMTGALIGRYRMGYTPLVIGHSMGGDFVWNFADEFATQCPGQRLPLMISIDPVDWTSDSGRPGQWLVNSCVQRAMNFRQPFYPGGGTISPADPKMTAVYEHTYNYPHADFGQNLAMDTAPDIHAAIVAAVLALIQRGTP